MAVNIPEIAGVSAVDIVVGLFALMVVWQLVVLVYAMKDPAPSEAPWWRR